jgi:hypothetical protein
VIRQLSLTFLSPFTLSGPVPFNRFFGRESELRQIIDGIGSTSFALVGGRRIGKSSILHRLHEYELPLKDFYSLYLDCSNIGSFEEFAATRLAGWQPRRRMLPPRWAIF